MTRYTDAYIEYWGEVFVKHDIHRRRGVPFVAFLRSPDHYMEMERAGEDPAPLLPAQQEVATREALAEMEAERLTQAMTPASAKVCGGRIVEPLRHHSHKHNPVPREVRHANR